MQQTVTNNLLAWAQYYVKNGWSVIPVRQNDKKAAIPWTEFQKRLPTSNELLAWFGPGTQNLAIVTGEISGITVLDDDRHKRGGRPMPELPSSLLEGTWTAKTPRGGRHHYFLDFDGQQTRAGVWPNVDIRSNGGYVVAPPSKINGSSYAWEKGPGEKMPMAGLDFDIPVGIVNPTSEGEQQPSVIVNFEAGSRDESMFHVALNLLRGGMSKMNAYNVVRQLTQTWNESDRPENVQRWVEQKIDSAAKRLFGAKNTEVETLVTAWIEDADGYFKLADLYAGLMLNKPEDRRNAGAVIRRMLDAKTLEAHARQHGIYRRRKTDLTLVNWWSLDTLGEWDIQYPFGLERSFITRPRNIIMVDGTTDGGKTLFMLHVAWRNVTKYPGRIHYFCSEMSADELAGRLRLFDDHERFRQVNFYDRSTDWADVIRPNDINIIDYLEISDEFYRVGGMIREIWERLEGGICLIGRQKAPGAQAGRGGVFGHEKARLVIRLEGAQAEIVKCKNRRDPRIAGTGTIYEWKLVDGWRMASLSSNACSEVEY